MSTRFLGPGSYPANLAVSAFRAVTLTTNGGVSYSTGVAGLLPDGITLADAAAGDYVPVMFLHQTGTAKCTLSATVVTFGDTLFWLGLGLVGTTGGTVTAGKSLQSTSSNGSVIEFLPKTSALN